MGSDAMILVFWMLSFKPTFSLSSFTFNRKFLFTFCHKGGVICMSEVIDISPGSLDSSLCFFQPSVSHIPTYNSGIVWTYLHRKKSWIPLILLDDFSEVTGRINKIASTNGWTCLFVRGLIKGLLFVWGFCFVFFCFAYQSHSEDLSGLTWILNKRPILIRLVYLRVSSRVAENSGSQNRLPGFEA